MVEPLLDHALELPPEQRAAFLDERCGADAELRAELARILEECALEDTRLARPAAERFAALLDGRDELAQLRTVLAGRYAVERELGRGGMGTVYLARDLRHERDVAIKVLAPELASAASSARFRQEIRLTARLRHPHILPLFDSGVVDGRPWYVSPYVEGGTLRERLARESALPLSEILGVLRDMASALGYAHERGVVHRDVKPENVLLDVGGAVLGDFGIARAVARATGSEAQAATLTGAAFGTPAYMAPEQRTPGAPTDHRVDFYALGVIAREMLAAHPAPPDALTALTSHLLAEHPEDRPRSAADVLRALDAIAATPNAHGTPPSARRSARRAVRRPRVVLGALTAGVIAIAGGVGWALRMSQSAAAPSAHRVLVVPFENATGDASLGSLGRMAADWVAQGLAETGAVEVSTERTRPEAASERGLRAVARERGAGTLVSGTYYLAGDSVRLQVHITSVSGWTLLRPVAPVAAARAAPQALLEPLRQRVMAVLAVTHDPRFAGWEMGSPPPTFEAYEHFLAGLDRFTVGDWAGALPHWERAAALDSSFVQPLLHSVFAYTNTDRYPEADSLARLIARRPTLAPFDRAMLEYQRALIDGDHASNLSAARAMVRAAPGAELPHFLHALAALRANRPRETLEAAAHNSTQGGRFGTPWSSANYWGVVTSAHHLLGDHEAELRAARGARELHPGSRDILGYELRALSALGRTEELEPLLDQLEALPATPRGWTLPGLLLELASELEAHGRPATAREVLLRAERWQRVHTGDVERDPDALYGRARTLLRLGDLDRAERLFARAAAERAGGWQALAEQGIIAARQGRRRDAERIVERLRLLQAPYDFGRTSYARARIAAQSGDRRLALALLRQAQAEGFPFGTMLHADPDLAPLRGEPEFRELLRPKG